VSQCHYVNEACEDWSALSLLQALSKHAAPKTTEAGTLQTKAMAGQGLMRSQEPRPGLYP